MGTSDDHPHFLKRVRSSTRIGSGPQLGMTDVTAIGIAKLRASANPSLAGCITRKPPERIVKNLLL